LQPIVENAVKHGIYPKKGRGTVRISIRKEQGYLIMEVKDDGVGMSKEKLCSVLDEESKNNGIGIRNVNERFKKFYGCGLKIESEENKGTTVIIQIPTLN